MLLMKMRYRSRMCLHGYGCKIHLPLFLKFPVFILLVAMLAIDSNAAESSKADAINGSLQGQELKELVALLENTEARSAFLQKLKHLEQAHEEVKTDDALDFSEALALDQKVGKYLKGYVSFFDDNNIRASSVGKIVTLGALTLFVIAIASANAWLSRFGDNRLGSLRQRLRLMPKRFTSVFAWQRWAGSLLLAIAWLYGVLVVIFDQGLQSWSMMVMTTIAQTVVAVLMAVLLFLVIWELISAIIEALTLSSGHLTSRRAMTLLPVARNVLTLILVLLSSLVILSELGIDVVPLLAGAGVVGIAIGFGAQTLVKDFLTGFTIIIEDLLQIGDVVSLAGRYGEITHISMRKVELRSLEGTVHTVPFSAIDIVDNLTKDYSYYMLNVGVGYSEHTDEVVDCLLAIDHEMRSSDVFGDAILEPLEVLGVDEFADSAVIIKARTKTRPRKKWMVGREFNRRIKIAFDEQGIEIPFPHRTLYFGAQMGSKE